MRRIRPIGRRGEPRILPSSKLRLVVGAGPRACPGLKTGPRACPGLKTGPRACPGLKAGPRACPEKNLVHEGGRTRLERHPQEGGHRKEDGHPQGGAPTGILSLADVVHRFKSLTTTWYRQGVFEKAWPPFPGRLWQRNYYERVIRSEDELSAVRQYIRENPMKWEMDAENPANRA